MDVVEPQSVSPTSRIRPRRKNLFGITRWQFAGTLIAQRGKEAVVKTYPIPTGRFFCIIDCQHVSALHQAEEKWQRALLLVHRGEQAVRLGSDRAKARALPG